MKFRKLIKFLALIPLLLAVAVGLTSISHPIILKWFSGSARVIGRPVNATVYADGQVTTDVDVFHVEEYWNGQPADYYLLYLHGVENSRLKIMALNRRDNYAGLPVSTNKREYDIIAGVMFQGEVGAKFIPMTDDIKGFNHDPRLAFADTQITLIVPPTAKELKCDSLRVVL